MIKPLVNILKIIIFCSLFLDITNKRTYARTLPTCKAEDNDPTTLEVKECLATPEVYTLIIYEMGLCVEDPLKGTTEKEKGYANTDNKTYLDSCAPTFISQNGFTVDFMAGATNLVGQNLRPPSKTYDYAYIKIKNYLRLKGKYKLDNTEYCSDGYAFATKGNPTCDSLTFSEDFIDFRGPDICTDNYESATYSAHDSGVIKALLTDLNDEGISTCNNQNQLPRRILGTFKPRDSIKITDATKGLEINFSVIDKGILVNGNDSEPKIESFASGSLIPTFKTF